MDGTFSVTLNDGLKYTATQIGGNRVTKYSNLSCYPARRTIDIHGCSFTYGTGVDDSLTFPFLVQDRFNETNITNYGIPGFGAIQALLKLKEKNENDIMPDVVIFCYADFQNERDELNASFQKKISIGYNASKLALKEDLTRNWNFPFGKIQNGKIEIKSKPFNEFNKVDLLSTYSAFWNQVELLIEPAVSQEVSFAAIQEIDKICKTNETRFIVACLTDGNSIKEFCKVKNIELLDMYVPVHRSDYNLMPYDRHPNAKAHKEYADLIIAFLEKGA